MSVAKRCSSMVEFESRGMNLMNDRLSPSVLITTFAPIDGICEAVSEVLADGDDDDDDDDDKVVDEVELLNADGSSLVLNIFGLVIKVAVPSLL